MEPTARNTAPIATPRALAEHAERGSASFSHLDYLPLRVSVRRSGWLSRRVEVVTIEETRYRNAILELVVPAEFVSDLASIPRPLFWFVSPWDIALESLFHDLLYREQIVARSVADFVLRMMLEERNVPWHIRWSVYLAVRVFGARAWRARRVEKASRARTAYEDRGAEGEIT